MEARDERRLLRLQKQIASHKLLIIDELGFVPLFKTGAELLFPALRARRHPDHQQWSGFGQAEEERSRRITPPAAS